MSSPESDQQGADEQAQLVKQIGRLLLDVVPPEFPSIRAEYRAAGRHVEADVLGTTENAEDRSFAVPAELVGLFDQLRGVMYRPDRGTWLSAVYTLQRPGTYDVDFELDVEPRWRRIPPPIGFVDELRRFPRPDEHVPDWFRQRAMIPDAPATPPDGVPRQAPTPAHGTPGQQGQGQPGAGQQAPGQGTPPQGSPQQGSQQGRPQQGPPQQGHPMPGRPPAGRPMPGQGPGQQFRGAPMPPPQAPPAPPQGPSAPPQGPPGHGRPFPPRPPR